MSYVLKKQQFKVQIRRENLHKILRKKKKQFDSEVEVMETIDSYFSQNCFDGIPKIFALKFQMIPENDVLKLISLLNHDRIKLDFAKPQNIAFISKIGLKQRTLVRDCSRQYNYFKQHEEELIIQKYFPLINKFALNLTFTIGGFSDKKIKQKCNRIPNENITNDLIYLPNCLLEYWSIYFALSAHQKQIQSYCAVMQCFIGWFASSSTVLKHFNKYSLCYFLRNFLKYQNFESTQNTVQIFRQVQNLYLRLIKAATPLIVKLIVQDKYFIEELNEILMYAVNNSFQRCLIQGIYESGIQAQFFQLLIEGIQNEQLYFENEGLVKAKFFYSEDLTAHQIKTLEELSIQTFQMQKTAQKVWKAKITLLQTFNILLTSTRYVKLLWKANIKEIFTQLLKVYKYSIQQGDITSLIQKVILATFSNILLLADPSYYQHEDEQENALPYEETCRNFENIKQFISQQVNFVHFIQFAYCEQHDVCIQLIEVLDDFSMIADSIRVDEDIFCEGKIILKICEAIKESGSKKQMENRQKEKVLEVLINFIMRIYEKGFRFQSIKSHLQMLIDYRFQEVVSDEHYDFLNEILKSIGQNNSNCLIDQITI